MVETNTDDAAANVPTDTSARPGLVALLDLQDADVVIDQLRHRRGHLPEESAIVELDKRRAAMIAGATSSEKTRAALDARQDALEVEIAAMTARIAAIDSQLSGGAAASYRDQSAMASEVTSLQTKRAQLEDDELAVMEELEPLGAAHDALDEALATIDEDRAGLVSAIADAQRAIDAELVSVIAERDRLAAAVPTELREEYEQLRAHLGGIGAARLSHGMCSGCRLSLPATEVDRIHKAPSGTLVHCDQCGRILVPV